MMNPWLLLAGELIVTLVAGLLMVIFTQVKEIINGNKDDFFKFLTEAKADLHRVALSVESLNIKMAAIVPQVEIHEKRLDRLEDIRPYN